MRGFTMLELLVVLMIVLIIAAIGIPAWMKMNRSYTLRNDTDKIANMINASRMRGGATFSRVKVDCSSTDATNCRGSSAACTVTLIDYVVGSGTQTSTLDSPQQRVCLSPGISLATPSSTYGVQTQYSSTPTLSTVLYFNSLGFPITSSGGTSPNYAMYLTDTTNGSFMAIGIAANGKPNEFILSGNTWLPRQ
ncbi:MAG: prepilin-type N-terminal cleavage/methylation domain-containing protein [Acidobacteriota bacterium]|nr:prepilin-type N-terminal cleavage/methylation domain-containing protein [Acidobacteriota bacterium]